MKVEQKEGGRHITPSSCLIANPTFEAVFDFCDAASSPPVIHATVAHGDTGWWMMMSSHRSTTGSNTSAKVDTMMDRALSSHPTSLAMAVHKHCLLLVFFATAAHFLSPGEFELCR